ncbi:MAG: hypothetical protein EYC70_13085 [Planctomycetota bacterium]|nr:MAG: hypothetical protein EYC70_13085 [Planctomycetota bacterium]
MLRIYYHRDFDGMAAAAILADALEACRGERELHWSGVNFDRTLDWSQFALGERFALVDFHFHPRAEYWFDHHPTTFLSEADRALYREGERHRFDPAALSCPPIILRHGQERWEFEPVPRHHELARWSDMIDAAHFRDAQQALFGEEPALRINRALTCAPDFDFYDRIVALMRRHTLPEVAEDEEIDRCHRRAARNRDQALESFPARVVDRTETVLFADLRSKKIRRERFAPFYLYPELHYAVTLLPTRAGVHITAASNPWNRPRNRTHLGNLLRAYGGGGHEGVAGVNPPDDATAERWARATYDTLVQREQPA